MLANLFGADLGIVAVIIIAVLLFGSQAPKLARNMGLAGREFRKAQAEAEAEAEAKAKTPATLPAPPVVPAAGDDKVTLSKAELDALLTEREARAKRESSAP